MNIPLIRTEEDLILLVNEIGFLPFFENKVTGWSLEEHIAPQAWYGGFGGPRETEFRGERRNDGALGDPGLHGSTEAESVTTRSGKINWPAWEWKGDVARNRQLVYGKFFAGKAGFVSLKWFPDFCNYRRDGYDLRE